jgi:UDP-GlcNAc:undecaprenyl-phosphate GlcNAc-1-phosphate transferase
MTWICLALLVLAFSLSLPLTGYLIHAGRRWGQLDAPDAPGSGGRKNHAHATPNTGGIGIFLGVAIPLTAILAATWLIPQDSWALMGPLSVVGEHIPGLRQQTPAGLGVLVALTAMHILGLIDDRKRLGPFLKLGVQLGVALFLAIFCDVRVLHLLEEPWGIAGLMASVVISVLWMVVITNAMNFLDNMDGLTGGVAAIIASLFLGATLIHGQWFIAAMAALLVGSLIGFLYYNFPPAKVFMGDGGSLVVGLLLAIISIRTTYLTGDGQAHWHALLMPLVMLAVPLYDFTSVTVIRIAQGRSPFVGDQSHFSHRLVRKGLSRRTAVLVIWLCTLATGLSGVMLGSLSPWQALLAGGQTLAILALLAMLERTKPAAE